MRGTDYHGLLVLQKTINGEQTPQEKPQKRLDCVTKKSYSVVNEARRLQKKKDLWKTEMIRVPVKIKMRKTQRK